MSSLLPRLALVPADTAVDAEGRCLAGGIEIAAEALKAPAILNLRVGEERSYGLVAVENGAGSPRVRLVSETEMRRLRVRVSDYGVLVKRGRRLTVTAREAVDTPIKVTAALAAGWRFWQDTASVEISVSIAPAQGFAAFSPSPLAGVPSAYWSYDRADLHSLWLTKNSPRQYMLDPESLGMHAKSSLTEVGWAACSSLAEGWKPLPLARVSSSDDKALICGELTERHTFSLTCRRKAGRGLMISAVDTDGCEHTLSVKVLPESQEQLWEGMRESPLMRTRRGVKVRRWLRGAGAFLCSAFVVLWLLGCLMAQISARGVAAGSLYTAAALGTGLGLVAAVTCAAFLMSALTLFISRKLEKK